MAFGTTGDELWHFSLVWLLAFTTASTAVICTPLCKRGAAIAAIAAIVILSLCNSCNMSTSKVVECVIPYFPLILHSDSAMTQYESNENLLLVLWPNVTCRMSASKTAPRTILRTMGVPSCFTLRHAPQGETTLCSITRICWLKWP